MTCESNRHCIYWQLYMSSAFPFRTTLTAVNSATLLVISTAGTIMVAVHVTSMSATPPY